MTVIALEKPNGAFINRTTFYKCRGRHCIPTPMPTCRKGTRRNCSWNRPEPA
jgi:hypothetical protein